MAAGGEGLLRTPPMACMLCQRSLHVQRARPLPRALSSCLPPPAVGAAFTCTLRQCVSSKSRTALKASVTLRAARQGRGRQERGQARQPSGHGHG